MYYLSLAAIPIGVYFIYRFTLTQLAERIDYAYGSLAESQSRQSPQKFSLIDSVSEVFFCCCFVYIGGVVVGQNWESDRLDFKGHCKEISRAKFICDYTLDDLKSRG